MQIDVVLEYDQDDKTEVEIVKSDIEEAADLIASVLEDYKINYNEDFKNNFKDDLSVADRYKRTYYVHINKDLLLKKLSLSNTDIARDIENKRDEEMCIINCDLEYIKVEF